MQIYISKPLIGKEEIKAVIEVLRSGHIAQGKVVKEFENRFAEKIGSKYAVAVSSGTTALHLSLLAYGIGKGDEVVTTPFSFIATANSILYTGAKPVFVDIDDTYNIDPELIEEKITKRTRAILPVHLYGRPVNIDLINKIASKYGLTVIEDSAQAHGAKYENGKNVGSINTSDYSFYATKNMVCGEGGMITTNSKKIDSKIRLLRNHGTSGNYKHIILGYNFLTTDILASIGLQQLLKLDGFNELRRRNAKYYTDKLKNIPGIILPNYSENYVFHQFTIRIKGTNKVTRNKLLSELINQGVHARVYYPIPIHKQPLFKKLGYTDSLPNAERIAKEVMSLPVHPALTKKELKYVTEVIKYSVNH